MTRITRIYTTKLYDMMNQGVIDGRDVADMCLAYMSEAAVEDMMRDNYLVEDEEDGDE
jgi:hypothetical protein